MTQGSSPSTNPSPSLTLPHSSSLFPNRPIIPLFALLRKKIPRRRRKFRARGIRGQKPVSFSEQVGMRACSRQIQNQLRRRNFINQKPIRGYVALSAVFEVANEGMILVLLGQRLSSGKLLDNLCDRLHVVSPLLCELQVLFELCGRPYRVHQDRISLNISSTSV